MEKKVDPIHFEGLYPITTREEQMKKVVEYLKHGNSCQIVGIPGVGRSNIFGLLAYNRNVRMHYLGDLYQWFHFVYMDFSEVKKRPFSDVLEFIFVSLSYSLEERGLKKEQEKINGFLKEALEFHDDLILFQALKKSMDYLAIEKELSIILLFDHFDQYIPQLTDEFFADLRVLRNRAKYRFSAVFSLARPIEDILEPTMFAEFSEFLVDNIVYLPLYDKTVTEFRFAYIEKVTGKTLDENVKQQIIELTGGHGRLTRLSYEILLEQSALPDNIEGFLSQRNRIKNALREIWVALLPEEQRDLAELSSGKPGEISAYLQDTDLVRDNKITIPLLQTLIKSLAPTSEVKITYDAVKNEIVKGAESLTEKLSPSEFRLLRYLIQNEDKVCEKDEIIEAVWKDSATQEGVTDQALDQIIYRLRKKVEDDPNNPQHINTIKGRGYKFTS